jgi:hypothetical protein
MELRARIFFVTLVSAAVTPLPVCTTHAGQPFVVTMDTSISGGAAPLIKGKTNLPDGTILWVRLVPPFPARFPHCGQSVATLPSGSGHPDAYNGWAVTVEHGDFLAGPAWKSDWPSASGPALFGSGRYILEIDFWSADAEPANAQAVIGHHGEYMKGPLVGACCFGYGQPGRHATQADAQKEMDNTRALTAISGPGVYYARYVLVP